MNPSELFPANAPYNSLKFIKTKIFNPTEELHLTQEQTAAIQNPAFVNDLVRVRWSMAFSSHTDLIPTNPTDNLNVLLAWRVAISVQDGVDVAGALAPGPVTRLGIPVVLEYLYNFPGRALDFVQAESDSHVPGPAGCVIADIFTAFLRHLVSDHILSPLHVVTPTDFTIMHVLVAADDCNGVQICQILVMNPQPLKKQTRLAPTKVKWDEDDF